MDGQTSSTRSYTQTIYNQQGQVTKQIMPGGDWKGMTYDVMGRLKTVTVPVDDDATHNQTSTTDYNEQGQKIAQVDAKQRRTTFEYDSLGRTTKRTLPNGKFETMTYNVLGQVVSKTDFNGKTTTFAYDLRGRLLSKTPDASLNEDPITYSYPNELTKVVTRGTNVTTYKTDLNRGWLNSVENSGVVDGRIEYSYDAAGNKTSVESVAIKDGVEQKNKTLFTYDALGRTDRVTFSDGTTTTYGYDTVGNRETVTRSNGTATLYRFDNQNRLISQQNVRGAGTAGATVLSSFVYDVRADGKRTGVREQVLNPQSSSVAMTTRTIGYDFDRAGRLNRETREERQSLRAGGETSSTRISGYEFDEVSNRKKLTTNAYNGIGESKTLIATSSVDYSYNSADELTEETTTNGATSTSKTYSYDDNGAQTSITANNITTPYTYDFEGKLTQVGDASSSTRSSYAYDGDGNRLSAIVTTGGVTKTTKYLNDVNTAYVQVVEERDENGVLQARYDYGDMDLQKLYRRDANGSYLSRWFLNDGLESTRQLVDANGVVTDSYSYDAFGTTLQRAGETENTRLYNGQQQDESGLYFLRARYYNSGNGRFLSHDPLLGNSDDPVTLHRYLYTPQDPINYSDPSGNISEGLSGVLSAISSIGMVATRVAATSSVALRLAAFRAPAWIVANAIRIEFYATVATMPFVAIELLHSASGVLIENKEHYDGVDAGKFMEKKLNANAVGYEGIDHYLSDEQHGVSFKSWGGGPSIDPSNADYSENTLIQKINEYADQLNDKTKDGYANHVKGRATPKLITSRSMLFAIPEDLAHLLQRPYVQNALRAVHERTNVAVTVAPIRNWLPKRGK